MNNTEQSIANLKSIKALISKLKQENDALRKQLEQPRKSPPPSFEFSDNDMGMEELLARAESLSTPLDNIDSDTSFDDIPNSNIESIRILQEERGKILEELSVHKGTKEQLRILEQRQRERLNATSTETLKLKQALRKSLEENQALKQQLRAKQEEADGLKEEMAIRTNMIGDFIGNEKDMGSENTELSNLVKSHHAALERQTQRIKELERDNQALARELEQTKRVLRAYGIEPGSQDSTGNSLRRTSSQTSRSRSPRTPNTPRSSNSVIEQTASSRARLNVSSTPRRSYPTASRSNNRTSASASRIQPDAQPTNQTDVQNRYAERPRPSPRSRLGLRR